MRCSPGAVGRRPRRPGAPADNVPRGCCMPQEQTRDYYEDLQVSSSAEPETIHRVYRLLAQQFHPDNSETGNEARFRAIAKAYEVLSDSDQRARYDIVYHSQRQDRWRVVAAGTDVDNEFALEQM